MKTIDILVADDHLMIRNGVRFMLTNQTRYNFNITEATNGEEALAYIEAQQFDAVILDITMHKIGGIEVLKQLRLKKNKTPIIIQTMYDDLPVISKTIELGAKGYIIKTSDHDELLNAIEHVITGKTYYSREINQIMIDAISNVNKRTYPDNLTEREFDVLIMITEGYSNLEISSILFVSKRTIEWHKSNIYEKTKTNSTQSLIKYALEKKIIHKVFIE
jgi:DNA-binding NarL/FixJ family response regulator